MKYKLTARIDSETGKIIKLDKPWWRFLMGEDIEDPIMENITLQLIKPIQDVIIMMNEEVDLDLDEYFLNAESYTFSEVENITLELNSNILKITPDLDWTGTTSVEITAHKDDESLEASFNIIVSEQIVSINTVQYGAILNQPVKWKKEVKADGLEEITVKLPKKSKNITVKKLKDKKTEDEVSKTTKSKKDLETSKSKKDKITGDVISTYETEEFVEVIIDEKGDEYEITYYTPAPYAVEETILNNKKKITIVGPEDVHYNDVLSFTELPIEATGEAIKLYWITKKGKEEVEIEEYDLNENGLIDYISWVVPSLSSQDYEVEINILNVQSYPVVGGNWEVRFTTFGTADLTISAFNGTTYGSSGDLIPLNLRCGSDTLSYDLEGNSAFYTNYSCEDIGYWTTQVLTEGVHTQEFNFGGQIAYAYNDAAPVITLNSPEDSSITNNPVINFNCNVVDENVINVTLYGNWSIGWHANETDSSGGSKDYLFTKTIPEGAYKWNCYSCDNLSNCTFAPADYKFTIDTTTPQINYGASTESDNAALNQDWIYVDTTVVEANEDTITFSLYNSTPALLSSTAYTDGTRTINWTGLDDGIYKYNVTINDTATNINQTETRTITLDTSAPEISFSCTPTAVEVDEQVFCNCTSSDEQDPNPTITYTEYPLTYNEGTFVTTCNVTDNAGNSISSNTTYSVSAMAASKSEERLWEETHILNDELFKQGTTLKLKTRERVEFKIDNESYYLGIVKLTEDSVTIDLSSTTQQASFSIGEGNRFNVNDDGYYDVYIKLENIEKGVADIRIKFIHAMIAKSQEEQIIKEEGIGIEEIRPTENWLLSILKRLFGR